MAKLQAADYGIFAIILIALGALCYAPFYKETYPFQVGSVVCLPNGARGTVQNVTSYRTTVLTTDNLNRMYTVEVIHSDIVECK